MPPIQLVGKTTNFCGKSLWEIVGNLQNFGVGRIVYRNVFFQRYKEPSFFRILKVHTAAPREVRDNIGTIRLVTVFAEKVFRGKRFEDVEEIYRTSYKTDYRLVPKHEEAALWARVEEIAPKVKDRVIPSTMPLPPLLEHFVLEEMKAKGEKPEKKLQLPLQIRSMPGQFYRLAKEGEVPDEGFTVTKHPDLYS